MKCSAVITIPARLASQRLPNKMLLNETGCTLIEHTWRNASKVSKAIDVFVITDSNMIQQEVQSFGGKAIMTSPDATSGTARIVEALPSLPDTDIVVNLQGDEPELVPSAIDAAITCLEEYPKAHVATLVTPLREKDALYDPSVVKAELTPWTNESLQQEFESCPQVWRAITFSRAAVPAAREWHDDLLKNILNLDLSNQFSFNDFESSSKDWVLTFLNKTIIVDEKVKIIDGFSNLFTNDIEAVSYTHLTLPTKA